MKPILKAVQLLVIVNFLMLNSNCQQTNQQKNISSQNDTIKEKNQRLINPINFPSFDSLIFMGSKELRSGDGTKSVTFNKSMSFLYAMNLEGMSVYEFSQKDKKLTREFRFKPTPGTGWDYDRDVPIKSFQEKPVESIITNNDSVIWISFHNAEGIIPIHLDNPTKDAHTPRSATDKLVFIYDGNGKKLDSFYVPLIKTGKTPKVIAATNDEKHLLVSNWHSFTVSVLETDINKYPYAKVITDIPVSSIPRGIVIDDASQKSYVAIMGGASLAIIDNQTWKNIGDVKVAANPRHVLRDNQSRLYVSYNKIGQIGCVDAKTGNTLFSANTPPQPRSMALSKDNKFLFVTCYSGDKLAVFKITDSSFIPVAEINCPGKPVGVDVYENEKKIEVWVCAYSSGTITVYDFQKK